MHGDIFKESSRLDLHIVAFMWARRAMKSPICKVHEEDDMDMGAHYWLVRLISPAPIGMQYLFLRVEDYESLEALQALEISPLVMSTVMEAYMTYGLYVTLLAGPGRVFGEKLACVVPGQGIAGSRNFSVGDVDSDGSIASK
ncbi:hypothetical protein D5086_003410 [Populus alba]|uniref:Uncharacterized protein n=1 Tax=Populus alba TaxID=43335 RepID=A0ACC4D5U8_POPAL